MANSTVPSKGRVFFTRLTSTVLLWCVMGYAIWAGRDGLFFGLAAFFGLATAVEYFRLLGGQSFAVLVVALQGSFALAYRQELQGGATLLRIFSTVVGVFYSTVCFGFLLRIADFGAGVHEFERVFLLLFCVMVTKFSDMGAYAAGWSGVVAL